MSKRAIYNKSNIKIMIVAHKPSELPQDNELFLPIQVGAKNAKIDLGLPARDDDGVDNISDKNPYYCELTAIYWAWKNLDADYYGLFHYRRFYSFSDEKLPVSTDGHMMVKPKVLTQQVFRRLGLLNEDKMRKMIEANDIIVHESRPVKNIPTPMGISAKTVAKHYEYHDGTIVKNSDIDEMINIINKKYPEISADASEYMRSDHFLGYNMFIMKKPYFNAMCQFLFGVLDEVEKEIQPDLRYRSLNANRIYGYLAEILTSIFIYYIRNQHPDLKVKELQMVYADYTDPIVPLQPIKEAVPIVFELPRKGEEVLFAPVWERFLATTENSEVKYDVTLAHYGASSSILQEFQKQIRDTSRIYLRFLDITTEKAILETNHPFELLLSNIFTDYDKLLFLKWNVWVRKDVREMLDFSERDALIRAGRDALYQGQINDFRSKEKTRIEGLGLLPYEIFDDTVSVWNLAAIHKEWPGHSWSDEVSELLSSKFSPRDVINRLFESRIDELGQDWNYRIITDEGAKIGVALAPIDLFKSHETASRDYAIGQFSSTAVLTPTDNAFSVEYYNEARKTKLFPLLISHSVAVRGPVAKIPIKYRLFPMGTRRHTIAKKIAPNNGVIYKTVRKVKHLVR